ncbi:MAG: DUF3617 family protein [Pseudomonadota bacterium]
MVKEIFIGMLILFSVSSPCLAGGEPNMQEGLWEITTTIDMPGMPAGMPPMKQTQCMTKKDMIPQNQEKGQDCKIVQTKLDGNTVTWTMKCGSEEGAMEGSGKITYAGDRFNGSFIMTMQDPEQGKMQMTQKMSGRKTGPCK